MSDHMIHVAIPCDDAYWFYALVAAASAVRASSCPVHIHILDGGVSPDNRDISRRILLGFHACREVTFHTLDMVRLRRFGCWHGSPVAYSRIILPEILPGDLDWVISADADVFFRGDVAALWGMKDNSVSIIPSRDCPLPPNPYNLAHVGWYGENGLKLKHKDEYFCDGICLVNLKRWRAMGVQGRCEEFVMRHRDCPSADQTVLNYVLQDDKKLLPRGWGAFSGDENADVDWSRPGCVHFVEDSPWRRWKCTHLMSDLALEWWHLAEEVVHQCDVRPRGYRGCRNRLDYAWRRFVFVFLKRNQWIVRLNRRLWLHLRSTRGVK